MENTPIKASEIARYIIEKMSFGRFPLVQFSVLELLLEKDEEWVRQKELAAILLARGIIPKHSTLEISRIQVQKALRILDYKLAQYWERDDKLPDLPYMEIERYHGRGVRLTRQNSPSPSSYSEATVRPQLEETTNQESQVLEELRQELNEICREFLNQLIFARQEFEEVLRQRTPLPQQKPMQSRGLPQSLDSYLIDFDLISNASSLKIQKQYSNMRYFYR